MLKEHEAGAKTADLARKHGDLGSGSSTPQLEGQGRRHGCLSEGKRLKQLEDENAKLKENFASPRNRCWMPLRL